MRLPILAIVAALAISSLAQSSSTAAAGGNASSLPAASSVASQSIPASTTSGFLLSALPSISGTTQENPSNNDITVSNGVTLTGDHATNTAKHTGGDATASSSSSPGAAAPTTLPGMLVGGVVGVAALGIAALL